MSSTDGFKKVIPISIGPDCLVAKHLKRCGLRNDMRMPFDWTLFTDPTTWIRILGDQMCGDGFDNIAPMYKDEKNHVVSKALRIEYWHQDLTDLTVEAEYLARVGRLMGVLNGDAEVVFIGSIVPRGTLYIDSLAAVVNLASDFNTLSTRLKDRYPDLKFRIVLIIQVSDGLQSQEALEDKCAAWHIADVFNRICLEENISVKFTFSKPHETHPNWGDEGSWGDALTDIGLLNT